MQQLSQAKKVIDGNQEADKVIKQISADDVDEDSQSQAQIDMDEIQDS